MTYDCAAGLDKRTIVITGAAGGIGRAVAQAFADVGSRVVAVDLHQSAADETVAALAGSGHIAIGHDLSDVSRHGELVDRISEAVGSIGALVQTAAVLVRRASIYDVTEEDWDLQHGVNLKSSFFFAVRVAAAMEKAGQGGRIINFTSQGWQSGGLGGSVAYAATKGGIVSMTRGLARSLASARITVNAVSPGAVDTAMMRSGMTDEGLRAVEAQIPLGYMAAPSQLAGSVLFLASDNADYVTGATLNVSGGWLMY